MKITICFVTAPSSEVASALAKLVVDQRLAACVNIVPGVQSVYRWNDEVTIDSEVLMIMKTSTARLEDLKRAVLKEHPYDTPEFIAIEPSASLEPYAQWVVESTVGKNQLTGKS